MGFIRSFGLGINERVQLGANLSLFQKLINDGNTVLYYDSENISTIVKDGTNKTSVWKDSLESGKDLLQAEETRMPIFDNTDGSIFIDGINDMMRTEIFASVSQPCTYYLLVKIEQVVNDGYVFDSQKNALLALGQTMYFGGGKLKFGAGIESVGGLDCNVGNWIIVRAVANGVSSELTVNKLPSLTSNVGDNPMCSISLSANSMLDNNHIPYRIKKYILRNEVLASDSDDVIYKYLHGKKIQLSQKTVFLGDSITWENLWQPTIIENKNKLYYSVQEVQGGVDGYAQTGLASSRIVPLINNAVTGRQVNNSIYERADSVKYYSPDLVILMGGQNDINCTLGTINDEAYTGMAVESGEPTFYASYKGTLKKLKEQNPLARIICVSPLYATDTTVQQKQLYVTAIGECALIYGCVFIDLLNGLGINASNHTTYLRDGVHPTEDGGILIGDYISEFI